MNFPHFSGSWEPIIEPTGALVLSHMTHSHTNTHTHTHTHYTSRICTLIISYHLRLRLKVVVFLQVFIKKIVYFSFFPLRAACLPISPSFIWFSYNTVTGQKKKSRSSSICRFFYPPTIAQSVQWLGEELNNKKSRFDSWQGQEICLFSVTSGLALGPALSPTQRTWDALSPEYSGLCVKITIHRHLAPRLRMSGATPPFPPTSSYSGA